MEDYNWENLNTNTQFFCPFQSSPTGVQQVLASHLEGGAHWWAGGRVGGGGVRCRDWGRSRRVGGVLEVQEMFAGDGCWSEGLWLFLLVWPGWHVEVDEVVGEVLVGVAMMARVRSLHFTVYTCRGVGMRGVIWGQNIGQVSGREETTIFKLRHTFYLNKFHQKYLGRKFEKFEQFYFIIYTTI